MSLPEIAASPSPASAPSAPPGPDLEQLRQSLPEEASDIKLNLQSVLAGGSLTATQRYGVALSVAWGCGDAVLAAALEAEAARHLDAPTLTALRADARVAAALMSMNNVFYRFRHLVGKPSYEQIPARLRMNRLARPATSKIDLELFSLAVSAVNGCGACVQAHENVLTGHGVTEEQVHDAVRIAATVNAASVVRSW